MPKEGRLARPLRTEDTQSRLALLLRTEDMQSRLARPHAHGRQAKQVSIAPAHGRQAKQVRIDSERMPKEQVSNYENTALRGNIPNLLQALAPKLLQAIGGDAWRGLFAKMFFFLP